jgi:phospholipase C
VKRLLLILAACGDNVAEFAADQPYAAAREACAFNAGAMPEETLGDLRRPFPIQHLIVLMQENRSFDLYLGHHPLVALGRMDGMPAGYTNPDANGGVHAPSHATTSCINPDLPHSWNGVHAEWDNGLNDGFYSALELASPGKGANALAYYEPTDLPFYTWLYGRFATSDRYFCAVLGPTLPNRNYLFGATSYGAKDSPLPMTPTKRSVFDELEDAGVSYALYNPETYNIPPIPMSATRTLDAFFADLASDQLPLITFVNADFANSEHPPLDTALGEQFIHDTVLAFIQSPSWSTSALVITYDEHGGFADHVPPPPACIPDDRPENADFDHLGIRVPMVVVSPYARPYYVSHRIHSHNSITRLVEAVAGLPALTRRDANSDALLDLFDFDAPAPPPNPATIPAARASSCH